MGILTLKKSPPLEPLETAFFHAKNDPEIGGRILGVRHLKRAPQNVLFWGRPPVREGAWRAKNKNVPKWLGKYFF